MNQSKYLIKMIRTTMRIIVVFILPPVTRLTDEPITQKTISRVMKALQVSWLKRMTKFFRELGMTGITIYFGEQSALTEAQIKSMFE